MAIRVVCFLRLVRSNNGCRFKGSGRGHRFVNSSISTWLSDLASRAARSPSLVERAVHARPASRRRPTRPAARTQSTVLAPWLATHVVSPVP